MIDPDAILNLYIERGDGLDASSYDIDGLCSEVKRLRAELIAALESLAATTCSDAIMYDARKRLEALKK